MEIRLASPTSSASETDSPEAGGVALLRRISLFRDIDRAGLEDLFRHCRRRVYKNRTHLFEEGDSGHTLFVILRGSVVIQKISPDTGEPVFVAERASGECIGEMALFDDSPRSAGAVAQAGSELMLLGREDFLRCVRRHPEVAMAVIHALSSRLRDAAEQAARSVGLDVMGRLAIYLLETAALPASGTASGGRRIVAPRQSDREIGERIAATRESVNRKLSQLARLRIVERRPDAIVLLDEKKLAAFCGGAGAGK